VSASIPVFYDCEATSIGGMPIEIGWADPYTESIRSEARLIRPPAHWDIESLWDTSAENLHNISRGMLARSGCPAFVVARRMNAVLSGHELFSDAPNEDERWLRILFDEAGGDPAFTIRRLHADELIGSLAVARGWNLAAYETTKDNVARLAPRTHRAEADARHLALLWRTVSLGAPIPV